MAGCRCDHGTIIINDDSPIPCEDCLYVTSHILGCEDGLRPCGDDDDILIETNCEDPTFTIIYYDEELTNVQINSTEDGWLLTFESIGDPVDVNEYYEIRYKVTCADEEFEDLAVIGTARICIKDPCTDTICEEGEECDSCGDCVAPEINLGLNIS